MAGFSTYDSVINAVTVNGKMQKIPISKLMTTTQGAQWNTTWDAVGIPAAGSNPTAGVGNAATCSSSTTGAIIYTNGAGGTYLHLTGLALGSTSQTNPCALLLVDRLAHCNIANDQATSSFSPVIDGTARLASGEGGMIILENTATLSGAVNQRSFTYTNQAGTGSRVTETFTCDENDVHAIPTANYLFINLQNGDTGCRSIESTTLVSGSDTGNFNVCIVKPLVMITTVIRNVSQFDFIIEVPWMPKIPDNACLMFYAFINTIGNGQNITGEVRMISN